MPANVVKSKSDERYWKMAKEAAKKAGRAEDWPYVMGIFKKMSGKESLEPIIKLLLKETKKNLVTDLVNESILELDFSCPGSKLKSFGKGRGLGFGKGQGPLGRIKDFLSKEDSEEEDLEELAAGDIKILNAVRDPNTGEGEVRVSVLNKEYRYKGKLNTINSFERMLVHGAGYNALNFLKKNAELINAN